MGFAKRLQKVGCLLKKKIGNLSFNTFNYMKSYYKQQQSIVFRCQAEKISFTYSKKSLEDITAPHYRIIKSPCDSAVLAKGRVYAWLQDKELLTLLSAGLHDPSYPHIPSLSSSRADYWNYHSQSPNQHCWTVSIKSSCDSQQHSSQVPSGAVDRAASSGLGRLGCQILVPMLLSFFGPRFSHL